MKKYGCDFRGREVNAIGIFHGNYVIVEAENKTEANLKLYETHDHISQLNIVELGGDNA